MKAVKHFGICAICGQYKELSQEHIPPKNAFNSSNVRILSDEEALKVFTGSDNRLPWDTQGLKGYIQQGGFKKYCLCRSCNSNTGQWYMRAYTDFAKAIHRYIVIEKLSVGYLYSFIAKDVYPLRLYKAMITMICDINSNCFNDENLQQFILNKEDNHIDTSKYSLYMFLVSSQMPRIGELSGIWDIRIPNNIVFVSEVASYPIGIALYLDKPKNYIPFGFNVDEFVNYDYNTKEAIQFTKIPYIDINSKFPADYRPKDEILKRVEGKGKEIANNNE